MHINCNKINPKYAYFLRNNIEIVVEILHILQTIKSPLFFLTPENKYLRNLPLLQYILHLLSRNKILFQINLLGLNPLINKPVEQFIKSTIRNEVIF